MLIFLDNTERDTQGGRYPHTESKTRICQMKKLEQEAGGRVEWGVSSKCHSLPLPVSLARVSSAPPACVGTTPCTKIVHRCALCTAQLYTLCCTLVVTIPCIVHTTLCTLPRY